jgi:hypothetical protein
MKMIVTGDQIVKLLEKRMNFNFDSNHQQSIHYRWCRRSDSVAPETYALEENYLRKRWLAVSHTAREILDMVH